MNLRAFIFNMSVTYTDMRYSKSFQLILEKQGFKFMLNAKVLSAETKDGKFIFRPSPPRMAKQKQYVMSFTYGFLFLYHASLKPISFSSSRSSTLH